MCLLLLVSINLCCVECLTTGQEVYGLIGSDFHVEAALPVDYQVLVTDGASLQIPDTGLCSTHLFQCRITNDDAKGRLLTLSGKMSEHLNYVYLFSEEDLVPTTVYFFNNSTWSEAAPVLIDPTHSVPIVRHRVPKNTTVKLTYFIKKWYGWFQLFTTVKKTLYYSTTNLGFVWDNYVSDYPHILKVAHANNEEGKVVDVEVKSNGSTDYYTCNYGDAWLTHVIHWEESMTTTTTKAFVTTTTTTEAIIITEKGSASEVGQDAAPMPLTPGSSDYFKEWSTNAAVTAFYGCIKDNSKLRLSEIVGIVIGTVCAVTFFAVCGLLAWRRTQKFTGNRRRDDKGRKSEPNLNQLTTV